MGNECLEQEVHVVRAATQNVLLGLDFLSRHHAVLDIEQWESIQSLVHIVY